MCRLAVWAVWAVLLLAGRCSGSTLVASVFGDSSCSSGAAASMRVSLDECVLLGTSGSGGSSQAFLRVSLANSSAALTANSSLVYSNFVAPTGSALPCNGTAPSSCTVTLGVCAPCLATFLLLTATASSASLSLLLTGAAVITAAALA